VGKIEKDDHRGKFQREEDNGSADRRRVGRVVGREAAGDVGPLS
jgi:hypothetical protein